MRAVVQRVNHASVSVDDAIMATINKGIVVFLGITATDGIKDQNYIIDKILSMRIFNDDEGKMNLSIQDFQYEILVISQFTLYGDLRKGRRPSFTASAKPQDAKIIYENFIDTLENTYNKEKIKQGQFQADMKISSENDGPVTILLDSQKEF